MPDIHKGKAWAREYIPSDNEGNEDKFEASLGIPSGSDESEQEDELWRDYDDDCVQRAIALRPANDNIKKYKLVSSLYLTCM